LDLPTYDQFLEPLLRFLASKPEGVATKEVHETLAAQVGLSVEAKGVLLPSRSQPVYKNRIGWAHDRLKRAGLSTSPRRGVWCITDKGRAYINEHAKPWAPEQVEALAKVEADSKVPQANGEVADEPRLEAPDRLARSESPEETIGAALAEIRASVAHDLLEAIARSTPEEFERLVLDVLHAMGYGTTREALQHVGGSGDGGIDGIISLDRLGLEKVYVQAKKWQGQVGSPQVQTFMGALQLQGANKGVLIAAGPISRPACETAKLAKGSVVLIDGARLAQLMIDHGVGVSHKELKVPHVDLDYFEDD